jgi:endonuclease G, mitochondrial
MRKILLSTFLITLQLSAWANPIDDNCPQHTTLGAPVSSITENTQYICHTNYAVHYRYDTKTAEFVIERLDKADITGPAKRKNNFGPDPKVDDAKEAQLDDYKGHPYDRGHLSPAADNRADNTQMSESFYLTNMVPQDPGHNRGIWRILEIAVRNTAMTNDIYVVSGTIYDPGFKTIGAGRVGVPSRIWKIVYNATNGETIAFLFPNAKLSTKDLPKYAVAVDEVEKATGINVFPKLDEQAEARFDPAKWPEIFK